MDFIKTFFIVLAGFCANETVIATLAIKYGLNHGFNLAVFAVLFALADLITVPLPYLGLRAAFKRFPRFHKWLERKVIWYANQFKKYTGDFGDIFGSGLLGYLTSTWLASLTAAFLNFPLRRAILGITIGDMFFFATLYSSITGMLVFLPESKWSVFLLVIGVLFITGLIRKAIKITIYHLRKYESR